MKVFHSSLRNTKSLTSKGEVVIDAGGFSEVEPALGAHLLNCGWVELVSTTKVAVLAKSDTPPVEPVAATEPVRMVEAVAVPPVVPTKSQQAPVTTFQKKKGK